MKHVQVDPKHFKQHWEKSAVVLVEASVVRAAEGYISGCEHCDKRAGLAFDYLLDELTGCDPAVTEYLLHRTAKCPRCYRNITEKTLILSA